MMEWSDGYVAGIDYPAAFFREQSPAHLSFSCVLNGVEPVPLDRPFTYMELGAGQGLTSNILAASNPQGQFYAVDFSPSQVASARQLAESAELDNLVFLENSFAELAAGNVALPPLDFITMYGVYSWVDAGNRRHILDFISRYLKPGGVVYLNYNAMPGWSATLPLQRLILEHARHHSGKPEHQLAQARTLVDALEQAGAAYFDGNPNLGYRLNSLYKDKAHYLAHEYMSEGWQPLYHADVARAAAGAKLDYIGSGELSHAFPELFLTPQQRALLNDIADPALRETVKDYLANTSFREDVYVRGARRMTAARQEQWLRQTGLALTSLPGTVADTLQLPAGVTRIDADAAQAILDALAERPHALIELACLPPLRAKSIFEIAMLGALLTADERVSTYFTCSAAMPTAPAQRMNAALAEASHLGDQYQALASPLLGNGVKSGLVQRLLYGLLLRHPNEIDTTAFVDHLRDALRRQGQQLVKDNRTLESDDDIRAELLYLTDAILRRRAPVWRGLQIL